MASKGRWRKSMKIFASFPTVQKSGDFGDPAGARFSDQIRSPSARYSYLALPERFMRYLARWIWPGWKKSRAIWRAIEPGLRRVGGKVIKVGAIMVIAGLNMLTIGPDMLIAESKQRTIGAHMTMFHSN